MDDFGRASPGYHEDADISANVGQPVAGLEPVRPATVRLLRATNDASRSTKIGRLETEGAEKRSRLDSRSISGARSW